MQELLIERMAQLALEHPDMDISNVYNTLMRSVSDAEVPFLTQWYALLLTVAAEARNAPADIQALIRNC